MTNTHKDTNTNMNTNTSTNTNKKIIVHRPHSADHPDIPQPENSLQVTAALVSITLH